MKNREIFLLGAGPSLRQFKFCVIGGNDFMVFNKMFLSYDEFPRRPTYHVVIDQNVLIDNKDKLKKLVEENKNTKYVFLDKDDRGLNNKEFFGTPENIIWCKPKQNLKRIRTSLGIDPKLEKREILDNLDYFGDAGCFGLQLCYHAGYNTVYLAGIDGDYTSLKERAENSTYTDSSTNAIKASGEDLAHYRSDYYDEDSIYTQPDASSFNHEYIWERIKKQKIKNFLILNVCPISKLKTFRKITIGKWLWRCKE